MSEPPVKKEERSESPPLLDPSRIQNPLAVAQQQEQQQTPQAAPIQQQNAQGQGFVMPEQPRQQQPLQQMAQQAAHWNHQRTPTMSPAANLFQQPGSNTPGSQRSSTGTPNHPMNPQQFFHGESPAHNQATPTPMTPQSAGPPPGSNCGTPQSAGPPGPNQPPYDYQAVQMQQQQQAQAMAAAQQQQQQQAAAAAAAAAHHQQQQQQQQFAQNPGQMHESPFRGHQPPPHPQMMAMHQHPGAHQYPPGYHPGPPNAQWQQQMYAARQAQAQAAAQQQQRVAQRVPYPPGAYPPGMAPGMPPGTPMTPVYPPPSPATRTTPGSAGPTSGPPVTPQRPQYPQGQNPQPPPQFAYPPAQQATPTGPGYPAGTPTFNSPAAHQMYRQGPPTGPPGGMRPQYISPQNQPHQPPPGTPHRFAPQTPSAGAVASPHFPPAGAGGPDVRSPPLMSPMAQQHAAQHAQAQAQAAQQAAQAQAQQSQQHTPHTPVPGVLPRALHPADMGGPMRPMGLPNQPLAPPPQGTPQQPLSSTAMTPQFQFRQGPPMPTPTQHPQEIQMAQRMAQAQAQAHHEKTFPTPSQVHTDPELFLAGCHIHCFDVETLVTDRMDKENLEFIVKFHGGKIDFDPSKFAEKARQITHVLIDSCRNPNVRQSLEQMKKIVSMQWLVDVLERQKTEIPWRLAHLPSPFSDHFRPYLGKLFTLSGFEELERPAIAFMVEAMGAKITPFLARESDLLIAKTPSEKVSKALEWKIPVVNYQWVADAYVCGSAHPRERPNVENPRYHLGQPCSEVNTQPEHIERASPEFGAMIRCWKQAIIIGEQAYEQAQAARKELHEKENFQFPMKKYFEQLPAPSDLDIKIARDKLDLQDKLFKMKQEGKELPSGQKAPGRKPMRRVVAFFGEGFDDNTLNILKRKVQFLGGSTVDKLAKATHVVLVSGRRSLTLLEAICRGKNIVDPQFIVDGYKHKRFGDTLDYFLRDKKLEAELSYSCRRSVLRARTHQVFEDMEFHVTKFVEPAQSELVRLIELAGGSVLPELPEPKYLARCVEREIPFIIVASQNDARSLSYLAEAKLPIYNVDLILFAMLRQNVEPLPQYRIPIPIVMKTPIFRQPPPYTAASSQPPPAAQSAGATA